MADMKKALAQWDAADELIVENMKSIIGVWTEKDITAIGSSGFNTYFDADNSSVIEKYNPVTNRVCILFNLKVKAEITSSNALSIPIGNLSSNDLIPNLSVILNIHSLNGYLWRVVKNNTNTGLSFNYMSGTIPADAVISGMLEWQLF